MEDGNRHAESEAVHKPVMSREVVELLALRDGGAYIDGTVGSGGHARLILQAIGRDGRLLGIDRDCDAVARARTVLRPWERQCVIVQGNCAGMSDIARAHGFAQVDGIVLDLGVSSEQIETTERGFSFLRDGPLDARMDRSTGPTAADLVNNLPAGELEKIIREFGEERESRRISRAIVREREKGMIDSTLRLAAIVSAANRCGHGRIHPATRTFQALRIAVNRELESLQSALEGGLGLLADGGRMAVISFHSLEDRIVKNCFREHAGVYESLEGGGRRFLAKQPTVRIVTRKPVTASDGETGLNPRARSAKLRVAERIQVPDAS